MPQTDRFPYLQTFAQSDFEYGKTIICFSHLRWDFVYQRPQQLMSRLARVNRVIYWEEPGAAVESGEAYLELRLDEGITVAVPHLPSGLNKSDECNKLRELLQTYVTRLAVNDDASGTNELVLWYYTPMMLPFSQHLAAAAIIYDCMDELANFKFAPSELMSLEKNLFIRADLVFTGGYSLYEAKRGTHPRVYPFPSSVDREHFAQARGEVTDPPDQCMLAHPRLGFYGVIDERMDLDLIARLADARPDWSLVMVGPVAKIGEEELPRRKNIHYLGSKPYCELPAYLSGWDVALMPFAINEATRFISPTKTPEYLAAGCPVVSTPIVDVIRHYGDTLGVTIARSTADFINACERALEFDKQGGWLAETDELLSAMDWDVTTARMWELVSQRLRHNTAPLPIASSSGLHQARTYDVMVVGAGFGGAVMAERLANEGGKRVLVVDRRSHVGGNAYDCLNDDGILIHQYGPHIFHTNSVEIFDYLSGFTRWRAYEHRVLADVDGLLVPIPINRTTLNLLYELDLKTDEQAATFLEARSEKLDVIETSEDVVVAAIGRELYETFFRGYTRKQWGLDPSQLDKAVTARVPTRTNVDDRYFSDKYQFMPADGYTAMFEKMLDHPNIDVLLDSDYRDVREAFPHTHLVFSGPIDEYFDYCHGKLPYRSLRFEHETLDQEYFQQVAVVNYPGEEVPFTRITEYKYLTGQSSHKTAITREYPCSEGIPIILCPDLKTRLFSKNTKLLQQRS